ncbi:MAG: sigma-54-dependent Fis family transcriptional regulator [Acidobacteria bacterium]|nr:sigma-54-dependent Fis family transcriptional regulator [Acidobacteriota bacterium]
MTALLFGLTRCGVPVDTTVLVAARPRWAYNTALSVPSSMTARLKTILVVDDDEGMRDTLTAILKRDHRVIVVSTGEAALAIVKREDVDLMLLDIRLPGIGGLEVLKTVKESHSLIEVIMISVINEVETAVKAMRLGAYHYIAKDFEYDALRSLVRNASEHQDLNRRVLTLSAQVAEQSDREFVAGSSKALQHTMELVHKVAKLSATVLILGESGTGKELLARLVHREGGRDDAPFITVNVAAIPSELVESALFGHEKGSFTSAHRQQLGKFELASGGTLFLDEIGDLRLDLQVKLLRAIQEGEIERVGGTKPIKTDFRLIAATNVDLDKAVKEGRFREDLYYRLNVIPIKMPPLRERVEDLPELVNLFIRRFNAKFHKQVTGISESALQILRSYWWPGNIRELENLIERLVAITDKVWLSDEDLPFDYHFAKLDASDRGHETLFQEACDTFERNFIIRALERSDWNVTAAARYLGLPLSTLKHKIGRLDIREIARRLRGA